MYMYFGAWTKPVDSKTATYISMLYVIECELSFFKHSRSNLLRINISVLVKGVQASERAVSFFAIK